LSLRNRLETEIQGILTSPWDTSRGIVIPSPDRLRLNANHAIELESATVLYADIDGSTAMVDHYVWWFAAEVYKTFLRCASQIIRECGGTITAYDGDRVMAIFVDDFKNTNAVTAALRIYSAVEDIIQPSFQQRYPDTNFQLKHVIGVDTSQIRAARIGIHGDSDIVWIGKAANYAAKLTSLPGPAAWITADVYNSILASLKFTNNEAMWEKFTWNTMGNAEIYRCTWKQTFA